MQLIKKTKNKGVVHKKPRGGGGGGGGGFFPIIFIEPKDKFGESVEVLS